MFIHGPGTLTILTFYCSQVNLPAFFTPLAFTSETLKGFEHFRSKYSLLVENPTCLGSCSWHYRSTSPSISCQAFDSPSLLIWKRLVWLHCLRGMIGRFGILLIK